MQVDTQLHLARELIRAKMVNAKREKEAAKVSPGAGMDYVLTDQFHHWDGQETMAKQLLDIFGG